MTHLSLGLGTGWFWTCNLLVDLKVAAYLRKEVVVLLFVPRWLTCRLLVPPGVTWRSPQWSQCRSKCGHHGDRSCRLTLLSGGGGDEGGSAVSHASHGEASGDAIAYQTRPGPRRPGESSGGDLQVGGERAAGRTVWRKGQDGSGNNVFFFFFNVEKSVTIYMCC